MQIKRLTRTTWGITPSCARRLYISVAIPRILYAVDVWCPPPGTNGTVQRGTVKAIERLASVQRIGATAITGALRTSPTDSLNIHMFLLLLPLLVSKWCHRAAVRLATLPSGHPLHKIISRKDMGRIKKHRSPVNHLLVSYNLNPSMIEKIPAAARDPMSISTLPFTISIANDGDSSITEVANMSEEIQIFTDGSALDGKVGTAVVLLKVGRPPHMLNLHLSSESKHTVHEAELIALLLEMHLLSMEAHGSRTAAIGCDNQAALKAFQSDLRSPGHHIARQFILLANKELKKKGRRKLKLALRWTAGHERIEGNELVDREPKCHRHKMCSNKLTRSSDLRS